MKLKYINFVFLAVGVTLLELALILAGLVTPVFENSPSNLVFSLMETAVIFWMGWAYAKEGLRKVALKGAGLMAASVGVLLIALVAGIYLRTPVLGIPAVNFSQIAVIFLFTSAVNIAIGALIAVCSAWIAGKLKKP